MEAVSVRAFPPDVVHLFSGAKLPLTEDGRLTRPLTMDELKLVWHVARANGVKPDASTMEHLMGMCSCWDGK
jgi:hypothetical protein